MSIRNRLLIMLCFGMALLLVAGGVGVYAVAETGLHTQFDSRLESKARALASLVTLEGWSLTFDSDDIPVDTLADTAFELNTASGDLLRRSDNLASALPRRVPAEGAVEFDDLTLPDGRAGRVVWYAFRPRVEADEEDIDPEAPPPPDIAPEVIVVTAAIDRSSVDAVLATVRNALLIVGIVLVMTTALLVTVGVRWGLRPLNRLAGALGGVNARTLSRRFKDHAGPRELEPIYRELNRMLDRVESTLERERTFAHAAAHELRTPLAELRTTAEVALRWPDSKQAEASLRELLDIGNEMEQLVESLLLICRGEANGAAECTAVGEIVSNCLEREADPIRTKRLAVGVEVGPDDVLPAPREAVEIIVRNLIDNAVHYTSSDGTIEIRGAAHNGNGRMLIIENGPVGLREDDMTHLFEPFWRLEQARSEREHAGLGLAVVQQIAVAIGLEVDAQLAGRRLRMRVCSGRNGAEAAL